jgi:multicomponent Na+:H+ antiporter subunit B
MRSLILDTTSRLLMGLLLMFSFFLLLRGHNLPGGGFAGGLVAASAFALQALSSGPSAARERLFVDPTMLIGIGLLIVLVAGLFGPAFGLPFLTGLWGDTSLPLIGDPGTPLLFDAGVYVVVMGISLLIIFNLAEEEGV